MTAQTLEGLTYAERRAARLAVPCPRCHAQIGRECTTPNGYATRQHKERDAATAGETPKAPKLGRLSDAQAQRIEAAAEAGYVAAPRWAPFDVHDRANITCVEKLTAKGLMVLVEETSERRRYVLTVAGWKVYREHRLVIRRLSADEIDAGEAEAVAREQDTTNH